MAPSFAAVTMLSATTAVATSLTNCSQQRLPVPGCRSATSVLESHAVFVIEAHSDANYSGRADIYDATTKTWTSSQMTTPSRTNMCATSWNHLAIFAGGTAMRGAPKSETVNVWDSNLDTWTEYNMSIGRDLLACASVGNFTVFAGGAAPQVNQSETDVVDIWNHVSGEWTQARLSQPRKKPEAVAAGGKIIIAGGEIKKPGMLLGYSDVVDIFDPATGEFAVTHLPYPPRQYFGIASVEDRAVFAGGFYNSQRLNNVDVYDPVSGAWTTGPPLSHNRSNLHGASIGGGHYAAFGSGNGDSEAKLVLDIFDARTGVMTASHPHAPGNPAVTGVGDVALFLGCDGVFDALAVDDPTCSGWNSDSPLLV